MLLIESLPIPIIFLGNYKSLIRPGVCSFSGRRHFTSPVLNTTQEISRNRVVNKESRFRISAFLMCWARTVPSQ